MRYTYTMKKKKETQDTSNIPPLLPFIAGGIAILIAIPLLLFVGRRARPTSVVDSPKTEMKKLPPDIKRQIHYASPSASMRVPILLYHYVEYVQDKSDKLRQELNIPPAILEEQIITLRNAGYTFMTAKDLGDVLDGKRTLPTRPILLTFDDGHRDFYTDILPILKRYQVHVTAYIISGFIGGSDFMTQEQLQSVVNSGLVDVGAHTVHHYALKGLPLQTVENEVDQSKSWIERTYHIHVVSFAYPNGSFDQQAIQVVKDAGFTTAVSTLPGIEQNQTNRFFLYRLRPGYKTGEALLQWLQQNVFQAYG